MMIKANQIKLKLLVFGAVNTTINDQGLEYCTGKPLKLLTGSDGYMSNIVSYKRFGQC